MNCELCVTLRLTNYFFSFSDAIVLYRAPQLANKFEPNFVKFDGKTKDDLNNFVKKHL